MEQPDCRPIIYRCRLCGEVFTHNPRVNCVCATKSDINTGLKGADTTPINTLLMHVCTEGVVGIAVPVAIGPTEAQLQNVQFCCDQPNTLVKFLQALASSTDAVNAPISNGPVVGERNHHIFDVDRETSAKPKMGDGKGDCHISDADEIGDVFGLFDDTSMVGMNVPAVAQEAGKEQSGSEELLFIAKLPIVEMTDTSVGVTKELGSEPGHLVHGNGGVRFPLDTNADKQLRSEAVCLDPKAPK